MAVMLLIWVTLQSTQCGKNTPNICPTYKQDTVLLNAFVPNIKAIFRIGDTVKVESLVTDNFTPLSGATAFTYETTQLYLRVQPYSIVKNSTLPELQYANIEFNPVVTDGQLLNINYSGYNYLYKKVNASHTLKIGFVAGKPGLYAFECTNGRYSYDGGYSIYRPDDICTNFWGVTSFAAPQKNLQYWDSLGVSAVSLAGNYGSKSISRQSRNYFLLKVIP